MTRRPLAVAVALLALAAAPAAAQNTLTPVFRAPYRAFATTEIGASLSRPTGTDVALEGFYGFGYKTWDIGLRAGFAERAGAFGGTDLLLGGDGRVRVVTHDQQFPLDGALTVGAGVITGNNRTNLFVPVGISLGRRFQIEDSKVSVVPYAHPVLGLIFGSGSSDVGFSLGLGADVRVSDRWDIRISGGVGDIEGISIGVAYIR